jgi:hypothetical protein
VMEIGLCDGRMVFLMVLCWSDDLGAFPFYIEFDEAKPLTLDTLDC